MPNFFDRKFRQFAVTMYQTLRLVLLFAYSVVITDAHLFTKYSETIVYDENFMRTLNLLEPRKLFYSKQIKKINSVSKECHSDLQTIQDAIEKRETWALRIFDATSTIPSGLIDGNLIDMGSYEECIDTRSISHYERIQTHHCSYSIYIKSVNSTLPVNPTLSVCLPTSCTPTDIEGFVYKKIHSEFFDILWILKFDLASCVLGEKGFGDAGFIVCMFIIWAFAAFLISCTVYDLMRTKNPKIHIDKKTIFNTFAEFSLWKSAKNILSLETKGDTLLVIHGMKSLSILWIVFGHECFMRMISINDNTSTLVRATESWGAVLAFNGQYAMDTFFTLSGFLITYMFFKSTATHKKPDILSIYLHRYLRITPGMVAILIFGLFLVPKLNFGPHWETVMNEAIVGKCYDKWWSVLLFIHNWVDTEKICLPHLWYTAADMQLFWISPIILYPLSNKPKLGLAILTAFLIISIITHSSVMAVNQTGFASLFHSTDYSAVTDTFVNVYNATYFHASPWFIGMFIGYYAITYNQKMKKSIVITGWILASIGFAFCFFGLRYFVAPDYVYNATLETTYVTITRPIWALSICWIIYASIKGCAGPISSILSLRIFLPFSRLSYSIYLVHMFVQFSTYGLQRLPIHHSNYNVLISFLSTFTFSTVAAFIFSLLFESPFIVLEKIFFGRKNQSNQELPKDPGVHGDESSNCTRMETIVA